jgi:hypothetical protein
MDLAAAIKTMIPCWRTFAPYAKALAVSSALLFLLTQQSFGADCAGIADTLARLRCFNRAADVKLPMPKGATLPGQQSREQRIRKLGGRVSSGQVSKRAPAPLQNPEETEARPQ